MVGEAELRSPKNIAFETQVIVIGSGAIGCSIAYHLARRNVSVVLVDSSGTGTGTSSATLGLVWVSRKAPAEYMELNYLSSRLHVELAKTFDEDVELYQPGGMATYIDESSYQKQLKINAELNAASDKHQSRVLTPQEAHKMEPELSENIVGAIYCPHDGQVNPIKLTMNLARNARKAGATFLTQTTVKEIRCFAGEIVGVDTSQGFIRAGKVVLAAGIGTPALAKLLGIDLPMIFEKGQILVTEAMRRVMIFPSGFSRQTHRGNVLLGTTFEANQSERITTIGGARKISQDLISRYPILKEARVIRQFAGIRPLPQDGKPYLGAVQRIPGLYVATSHSGITLCPVHGKVISELIIDGQTDIPIGLYRPERHMPEFPG